MKFSSVFSGNHIMLDLETLGSKPNSIILTLAAIRFNPWASYHSDVSTMSSLDCFYRRIDTTSFDNIDHSIDDSTLEWWLKQSESAKAEAFAEDDRHNISDALNEFRRWAGDPDTAWANGLAFDVPMIEFFCRETKQVEPWRWWLVRDARTLYSLCPDIKRNQYHDAHHALVDCFAQVIQLQQCFSRLGVEYLQGNR